MRSCHFCLGALSLTPHRHKREQSQPSRRHGIVSNLVYPVGYVLVDRVLQTAHNVSQNQAECKNIRWEEPSRASRSYEVHISPPGAGTLRPALFIVTNSKGLKSGVPARN